ncbi:MAG TPA: DoxX family protein [Ferruginibacter sp.]|nr:DoxX family protein [Ferruginibacter sp.]
MKNLMSTKYSAGAFNVAMLLLRLCVGGLMIPHGYDKLVHFNTFLHGDANHQAFNVSFLGLSYYISFCLLIFAEFFCAIFVTLGLFTRLFVIPLIISTSVALFQVAHGDVFGQMGGVLALFLIGYLVILLVGPGRISIDGVARK